MTVLVIDDPRTVVVTDDDDRTVVAQGARVVEVDVPGPQGPAGPAGPPGAPGAPGAAGGNYVHTQAVPAATWLVAHNLGMFPNVSVVDSAETVVIGQVTYLDGNSLKIDFSAGFSGFAYLS